MRVNVKNSMSKVCERDLSYVLTPSVGAYECDGQLNIIDALSRKNAEAIGKLIELLVEKEVLTLEEALDVVSFYGDVEPTNGS